MPTGRQAHGAYGEDVAARWYAERGFEVVSRNWRCPSGEIDLVCAASGLLVFCEVKARSSDRFGTPAEAVTPTKQRRLRRAAATYLAAAQAAGTSSASRSRLRFDVACVAGRTIQVIEDAF